MTQTLSLKSANPVEDQLMKFLETSQDLLSLVQHENAIMLKEGILSFEAYLSRKIDLMQGFEKEAQNLLTTISVEKGAGSNAQQMLAEEVKRVRDALQVNSAYQIQTLRKKHLSQDNNFAGAKMETESLCH